MTRTRNNTMPTAYLIGDSIAGGYAAGVQACLAGEVAIEVRPENGEDSRHTLARLTDWLGERRYDVIHFNCGLHDLRRLHGSGEFQVPLAEYESNLRQIVAQLSGHADLLIWGHTTPVIDGQPVAGKEFDRFNRDVAAYNQVADRVMAACGVAVDDLHRAIVEAGIAGCLSADGVHMSDQGYAVLSRHVGAAIRRALAGRSAGDSMNKEVSIGATAKPLAAKLGAGIVVPMVTPFTPAGDLDEAAVRRVVDHLLDGGVDGIFVLGTTGEDASIPAPMRARLVAVTVA